MAARDKRKRTVNILVIGKPLNSLLEIISKSKLLDKIYTAGFEPLETVPNIEYTDFHDLINKTKILQIDIAITTDKELIESGIVDIFRENRLNIIASNKKWVNLESQRLAAKKLMDYYSINNPPVIKAPLTFPIVIKSNDITQIASTMHELIEKREALSGMQIFLEDYLDGKTCETLFLWDGKNLLSFPVQDFTEVQADRFELLKTKLNFMLSDEKADFTGFFTTKLIWVKNDWYVLDFIMRLTEKSALSNIKTDFLYLLNAAIYQKLYEIR